MTTSDQRPDENLERLNENLVKIEDLSRRLIAAMTQRKPVNPTLSGPEAGVFTRAASAYWAQALQDPARIFEHQLEYWGKSVTHFIEAQQALTQGKLAAPEDKTPQDRRFSNPLWKTHPWFNFIKQQYMLNADAILQAVEDIEDIEPRERARLRYFSRQIVDMMAPTNFLGTNPDALEQAVATDGASLVKGLENLVADIEANDGELLVRLADEKAFELGGNIATTGGAVVFRNRMMELIQYAPATEEVHAVPLVIFPPWINKFYIMDLKPENSLIKWITEQGFTLFVVSWINPGAESRDIGMEDYIEEGFIEAIRVAKEITGQKQVNTVGYCIAGTTLNLALALLKKRADKSVRSATFFTTLTDFSDQGEFMPFLQDDFIDGIEQEVAEYGVLRSLILGRTMSFLRSNDLIYTPAIKSYMLGEAPPAFDLLFWNGDGSNLPAKMTMQYLHGLCRENDLVGKGLALGEEKLHISDVDLPIFAVGCQTDHIAPWKDCYRGLQQVSSRDRTFVMSESGHIAGIINPPSKKKYGHFTNEDTSLSAADWLEGAARHEGSWWPRWGAWLKQRSGKKVPQRSPGDSRHKPLCPAPGTYVVAKPKV